MTPSLIVIPPGEFSPTTFLPAALLALKFEGAVELVQTRNAEKLKTATAVIEVGDECDLGRHRYVSTTGADLPLSRGPNNIPLSAAGLIWQLHGDAIIAERFAVARAEARKYIFDKLMESMVESVDAKFHGIRACGCQERKFFSMTSFGNLLSTMDPVWENRVKKADPASLQRALEVTKLAIKNAIENIRDEKLPAIETVEEAFAKRFEEHPSGKILFLQRFVPWRDLLYDMEEKHGDDQSIEWVCFQDERTLQWRGTAVAVKGNRFANRALVDPLLRGLRDEELVEKCGIAGANFVHHSGFTCGATSKEAILGLLHFKQAVDV